MNAVESRIEKVNNSDVYVVYIYCEIKVLSFDAFIVHLYRLMTQWNIETVDWL